jgi:hypothetical protein
MSKRTMTDLTRDLSEELKWLMADTGELQDWMGGYRIKIFHSRAFPWDDVFKALLYRNFKVQVTRQKADLFIEATPASV